MKKLFTLFAIAFITVCAFAQDQDFTEVTEAKKLYGKWVGNVELPAERLSQMLGEQDTKGHEFSMEAPFEFVFKKGSEKNLTKMKMKMTLTVKVYKADGIDEEIRDELLDACGEGLMFANYELSKDGTTLILKADAVEEEDEVPNDELFEQMQILMSKNKKTIKLFIPDAGMTIIMNKK